LKCPAVGLLELQVPACICIHWHRNVFKARFAHRAGTTDAGCLGAPGSQNTVQKGGLLPPHIYGLPQKAGVQNPYVNSKSESVWKHRFYLCIPGGGRRLKNAPGFFYLGSSRPPQTPGAGGLPPGYGGRELPNPGGLGGGRPSNPLHGEFGRRHPPTGRI